MNRRAMPLSQIQRAGLEALAERLGPVGMVRFLQQFETGAGDYSMDRHRWLGSGDVLALAEAIRPQRPAGGGELGSS